MTQPSTVVASWILATSELTSDATASGTVVLGSSRQQATAKKVTFLLAAASHSVPERVVSWSKLA